MPTRVQQLEGKRADRLSLGRALDGAPMSALHVRFWLLAGLGILLDGFDLFIIGVANPLIKKDFHATATQVGLVSSAAIVGAVPESPRWLAQNGHEDEARAIGERLSQVPVEITPADIARTQAVPHGLKALIQPQLFSRALRRRTIFTAVPWFLMDIATYGVGIFTPTLLAAIVVKGANTTFIADDITSTKGTAALDIFLIIGFGIAIVLVDRVGRVPLQIAGFTVMAMALAILGLAEGLPGGGSAHLGMVIVGFAFFNTFMNAGPNSTTYALPAEVFPSEVRAAGHGFAAGCAKLGAALGVFLFPILQGSIGNSALLYMIAGGCLGGVLITALFRIEPKGRSLEEFALAEAQPAFARASV